MGPKILSVWSRSNTVPGHAQHCARPAQRSSVRPLFDALRHGRSLHCQSHLQPEDLGRRLVPRSTGAQCSSDQIYPGRRHLGARRASSTGARPGVEE
eukprot:2660225-Pyramimonas_sp.AAC.1